MIHVEAFLDELSKIAAHKSRHGSMPIHVHNLVKKVLTDKTSKITSKLAAMDPATLKTLGTRVLPAAALFGGGMLTSAAMLQAKRDWEIGRQMRLQGMA